MSSDVTIVLHIIGFVAFVLAVRAVYCWQDEREQRAILRGENADESALMPIMIFIFPLVCLGDLIVFLLRGLGWLAIRGVQSEFLRLVVLVQVWTAGMMYGLANGMPFGAVMYCLFLGLLIGCSTYAAFVHRQYLSRKRDREERMRERDEAAYRARIVALAAAEAMLPQATRPTEQPLAPLDEF